MTLISSKYGPEGAPAWRSMRIAGSSARQPHRLRVAAVALVSAACGPGHPGLLALASGWAGLPGRCSGKGAVDRVGLKAKKIRAEKAEIHGQSFPVWQSLRSSE